MNMKNCEACGGYGYSPEANLMRRQWHGKSPFRPEDRGSVPFLPSHPTVLSIAERNVTRWFGNYREGVAAEAKRLADLFNSQWSHHLNADDVASLVAENRLPEFTHIQAGSDWRPKEPVYTPTPEEVNLWSLSGPGHDSINMWVVITAECKRLSVGDTCLVCGGEGEVLDEATP